MKKYTVLFFSLCYMAIFFIVYVLCDTSWRLVYRELLIEYKNIGIILIINLACRIMVILFLYMIGLFFFSSKLQFGFEVRIGKNFFRVKTHSIKSRSCIISILICVLITLYFCGSDIELILANEWNYPTVVAHAGGEIDGYRYSNCQEAIIENYQKGYRTFEIDFAVTSDNVLVGKHDWDYVVQDGVQSGDVLTAAQFTSIPIFERYTPLTFDRMCVILDEYPDMWLITDTKDTEIEKVKNEIQIMVNTASKLGLQSVLDRVIIQIYNEEMYYTVKDTYSFDNYIFTMYQRWNGSAAEFEELARFCCKEGIRTVTIPEDERTRTYEIAEKYGVNLYMHTINEVESAQSYINHGVTGVYTDSILPNQLRRN